MILAQDTDVLLLDEPATFLDLYHQLEVMDIVEALRDESNITVVLVLYDIDQATRYADHVVALNDGAIYDRGPPRRLSQRSCSRRCPRSRPESNRPSEAPGSSLSAPHTAIQSSEAKAEAKQ